MKIPKGASQSKTRRRAAILVAVLVVLAVVAMLSLQSIQAILLMGRHELRRQSVQQNQEILEYAQAVLRKQLANSKSWQGMETRIEVDGNFARVQWQPLPQGHEQDSERIGAWKIVVRYPADSPREVLATWQSDK